MSTDDVRWRLDTALLRSMEAQVCISTAQSKISRGLNFATYALELHQSAMQQGWLEIADGVEGLIGSVREGSAALDTALTMTTAPAESSEWARNAVADAIDLAGSQSDYLHTALVNYLHSMKQCNEAGGYVVIASDRLTGAVVQPHMGAEQLIQEALGQISNTQTALDNAVTALKTADEAVKTYMRLI